METTTLTVEAQQEAPPPAVSPEILPEDVVSEVRAESDQILNGGISRSSSDTPRRRNVGGAWTVWR